MTNNRERAQLLSLSDERLRLQNKKTLLLAELDYIERAIARLAEDEKVIRARVAARASQITGDPHV